MTPERFEALVEEADSLLRDADWGAAALAWARVGRVATEAGASESARQAWATAGEAWRRADQIPAAARGLRLALSFPGGDPRGKARTRTVLAGVLSELGNPAGAQQLCEKAAQVDGPERWVAVDTWCGILLGYGERADVATRVSELTHAPEPFGPTCTFRVGQLARLAGDLEEAALRFVAVCEALKERGGPGRAAAMAELAELALLRGEYEDAIALYGEARGGQDEAGRRSSVLRCDSGRIRAMVSAGATPLSGPLDDGVAWAEEREMALLAIDLRISRGMVRAERDPAGAAADLDEAIAVADRIGARRRAGRARYERGRRIPDPEAGALLAQATEDLRDSAPWCCRAQLAHATIAAQVGEGEAWQEDLPALVARFRAMGMEPDAEKAMALLHRLG